MSRKQIVISVEQDSNNPHPRDDFDMIGTMYTWHRNYALGGKDDLNNQTSLDEVDTQEWLFDHIYLGGKGPRLPEHLQGFEFYYGDLKYYLSDAEYREMDRLKALSEVCDLPADFQDRYDELYTWNQDEEASPELEAEFRAAFAQWVTDNVCIKDLYLYDHSGISISCSPFSCRFDSGAVGFIYLTREKCEENGVDFAEADLILEGEVKTLDHYFTGDVWGFNSGAMEEYVETDVTPQYIDDNVEIYLFTGCETVPDEFDGFEYGADSDSCGGFYGEDYMMEHIANEVIPYYVRQEEKRVAAEAEKRRRMYWCM